MLVYFKIKNFRSIGEIKLDFSFGEKRAPAGYKNSNEIYFMEEAGKRLVPVQAIMGANASGKTNVIKAFVRFVKILDEGIAGNYEPNLILFPDDPTMLRIGFTYNKQFFEYEMVYCATQIISETFTRNGSDIFKICDAGFKNENLSDGIYDIKKLKEILLVECVDNSDGKKQVKTFLNTIAKNYPGLDKAIPGVAKNLVSLLPFSKSSTHLAGLGAQNILKILHPAEYRKFHANLVDLLNRLDFDIVDLVFEETDSASMANAIDITKGKNYAVHKNRSGEEIRFSMEQESDGTRKLIDILALMLLKLWSGAPLIIDELDSSLHPFILGCLVKLYKDKDYNPHNSQLLFTTHTTDILDPQIMRVSEVCFIDKSRIVGSYMKRACDIPEAKNMNMVRDLYLSGSFYGMPHPYI